MVRAAHATSVAILILSVHFTFKIKFPKLVTYPYFLLKDLNIRLFTVRRLAFSSLSDVISVCMAYFAKISLITFQRHPTRARRTLRNRLGSYLRVPVFQGLRLLDISTEKMNDS